MSKWITLISRMTETFVQSIKQFPIAITCAAFASSCLVVMIHNGQGTMDSVLTQLILAFALGFPVFIARSIVIERWPISKRLSLISVLLLGVSIGAYVFWMAADVSMMSMTRYLAISLVMYLCVFIVFTWKRRALFDAFMMHVINRTAETALVSLVITASLIAIVGTIKSLFITTFDEKIFAEIGFIICGWFAPSYLLGKFPDETSLKHMKFDSKIWRTLLVQIAIPLTIIYATILYAYFVKIIITGEWPIGMVANLVLWFGIICIILMILVATYSESSTFIRRYLRLFPLVLIPLFGMLFMAVGVRVLDYGWTEPRYDVVAIGVWVVGVSLYYGVVRSVSQLYVLATLAIVMVVMMFGPWSSFDVSIASQNARFEQIMNQHGLIKNGILSPASKGTFSDNEMDQIDGILNYFSSNHALKDLSVLPKGFTFYEVERWFGYNQEFRVRDTNASFNYEIDQQAVDVTGYDKMVSFDHFSVQKTSISNHYSCAYDTTTNFFTIQDATHAVLRENIADFALDVYQHNKPLTTQQHALLRVSDQFDVKIVLKSFDGHLDERSQEPKIDQVSFIVLIHSKN